jgi:Eukaryotic translation initiation factor 3 subunit 7 (eIF-3)
MGGRGGSGPGGYYNNRIDRQPSVAVQSDRKLLEDNDVYDKVTAQEPVPLKRIIALMTGTRSVYLMDIVIQKLPGNILFFYKRDNSTFDFLTVQETAHGPADDESGINTPECLGLEATMINQNFSQQI